LEAKVYIFSTKKNLISFFYDLHRKFVDNAIKTAYKLINYIFKSLFWEINLGDCISEPA